MPEPGCRGHCAGPHLCPGQPFDFGSQRRNTLLDLGLRESGGDVLRAVPVIALQADDHRPLDTSVTCQFDRHLQPRDQCWVVLGIDQSHPAQQLQATLVRMVHEQNRDSVIALKITDADVLHIAAEVSVSNGVGIQDLEKSGGSAAMLDIRPPRLADGRLIEPVTLVNKLDLVRCQRVVVHVRGAVQRRVDSPAPHPGLHRTHNRGERDLGIGSAHFRHLFGLQSCCSATLAHWPQHADQCRPIPAPLAATAGSLARSARTRLRRSGDTGCGPAHR